MMELDEAIKHAEEVVEAQEEKCKHAGHDHYTKLEASACAEEHRQLAEWLKELKALREQKRPHGEWHKTHNPNYSPFDSTSEVIYMCSQCAYSSGDRITATWNFCPNCGASMVKKEW